MQENLKYRIYRYLREMGKAEVHVSTDLSCTYGICLCQRQFEENCDFLNTRYIGTYVEAGQGRFCKCRYTL